MSDEVYESDPIVEAPPVKKAVLRELPPLPGSTCSCGLGHDTADPYKRGEMVSNVEGLEKLYFLFPKHDPDARNPEKGCYMRSIRINNENIRLAKVSEKNA